LMNPRGLTIGTLNGISALVVSDYGNGRVVGWQIPAVSGAAATFELGASSWTVCSPGAPVSANAISGPSDTFIDQITGTLFVSDTLNNRVLIFNPATYVPAFPNAKVNADGVVGQPGFTTGTAGSGTGNLNTPKDIIYAPASSSNPTDLLVILDQSNNRVQSFKGNSLQVTISSSAVYYYSYYYSYYPYYSSIAAAPSSRAAPSSFVAATSFVRPTRVSGGRRAARRALKKSWKRNKRRLNKAFF